MGKNTIGNKEIKLDANSMIVTETDEKGKITFASKDFCKISEYTKEELIGKPHNCIRNPFMPKEAFKDLWETVKSGQIWSGIVVNSTKSGAYYWVKATIFPSKTSQGETKFISVRVMPSPSEVKDAINRYEGLKK